MACQCWSVPLMLFFLTRLRGRLHFFDIWPCKFTPATLFHIYIHLSPLPTPPRSHPASPLPFPSRSACGSRQQKEKKKEEEVGLIKCHERGVEEGVGEIQNNFWIKKSCSSSFFCTIPNLDIFFATKWVGQGGGKFESAVEVSMGATK